MKKVSLCSFHRYAFFWSKENIVFGFLFCLMIIPFTYLLCMLSMPDFGDYEEFLMVYLVSSNGQG